MRVKKRIVNQKPFSAYPFEGYPNYTCVWDVAVSPKGDAYVSLCTEGMPAGFNARLFKLPAGGDRLIECVSNREVTCQEPGTSQMPHSKIHTSMQFDEDGKLYYVTYTTSPGRGHEFWDVIQLFDDPVQGYTGSHFVVYDSLTDEYAAWGIPAPRDMIYGGILDPVRRRYYYHTWLHGRLGYVDLEERCFRDVGRITRRASFQMFHDRRGRIFGATRDGQLWRYDPEANRIELLDRKLPRRFPERLDEMFITQVNHRDDGVIIGGCRGGHPLWLYDPEDGDQGSVLSLGNPWRQQEDGSCESGRAPLLGEDGLLYYWVSTEIGGDMHLIRMNVETREREDLGLGYIAGKSLGTWTGCGAIGPDGKFYWGDSGYETPRLIVLDPELLKQVPSPLEAEIEMPERSQAAGTPIYFNPVDASWSDSYVPRDQLKVIHVCGRSAPHGSSAITSLACTSQGTALALTSGRSCRLITYNPAIDEDSTILLHDTGIAGMAYHSLIVSPDDHAFFSVDPTDPDVHAPLYRANVSESGDAHIEQIGSFAEGLRTLIADWNNGKLYALTSRTNKLLCLNLGGDVECEIGPICDRQLSPTLALDSEGCLYGAKRGGCLWRLPFGEKAIEQLDLSVPSMKGRAYLVEWQVAATYGEYIYGSTSDGYLFRFEPRDRRLVNLGKPVVELGLRALTMTSDGSVYGAAGAPEYGLVRLFRYHPERGFEDLGYLDSLVYPHGMAVKVACMTTSPDGAIYIGEDDDISHLWAYIAKT